MAFDIGKFRSSFVDGGEPANPTNYNVSIVMPQTLILNTDNSKYKNFQEKVEYRCESINIPESVIKFMERKTYGLPSNIAYSAQYSPITISLIVSDDMSERDIFYDWKELIVPTTSAISDITYFDDYVGNITVSTFNKSGDITRQFTVKDAFPVSIQEIPLSWHTNNDYIRLNITFKYTTIIE